MDSHSATDADQGIFLEMMKEHLSHGLTISYPMPCKRHSRIERFQGFVNADADPVVLQQTSDGDTSSHLEQESEDNESFPTPVVYKKRARVKFTAEQVSRLRSRLFSLHLSLSLSSS